jgi:cysteine-rich repeat protein
VLAGVEACDDGNALETDGCLPSCVTARCGDGVVRAGVEACDDGNALETDGCLPSCVTARCGDGIVQAGVEACDDGNAVETDGCRSSCVTSRCGDGIVQAGVEACDDGNALETDGCLPSCVTARCGDGFIHSGVEACDDGNAVDTDGCSNACQMDAPVLGCGDVPASGQCHGTNLDRCDTSSSTVVSRDCGDLTLVQTTKLPCSSDRDCSQWRADLTCSPTLKECVATQEASEATCTAAMGMDGPTCASPEGGLCIIGDPTSTTVLVCGGAGGATPGLGCDGISARCQSGLPSCEPPSARPCTTVGVRAECEAGEVCREGPDGNGGTVRTCAFGGVCSGTRALLACAPWGQPSFVDCGDSNVFQSGGTCGPVPSGIGCISSEAGAYCDGQTFTCRAGLTCDPVTSRCQASVGNCESLTKPVGRPACGASQKCQSATGECVPLCDGVVCAYAAWCDDATGNCESGPPPAGRTGAACQTVDDCSKTGLAADQGVDCRTDLGGLQFPGGYCLASCDGGFACRQGASCLGGLGCLDQCTRSSDCRAGYRCTPVGSGEYACFPSSQCKSSDAAECVPVGGDCAADEDCRSGANCVTEQRPVTNAQGEQTGEFEFSGFERGYCIYTMRSSDQCPAGSTGVAVDPNDPNLYYCLSSCIVGELGCGLGESCRQISQTSAQGVCWQSQCFATSECQTATCTHQDISRCGKGQACTGGFCRMVDKCTSDADCPAISQDGSIHAACDTDRGECRMAAYCDGSLGSCTVDCTVADVFSETFGACAGSPCQAGFICMNDATAPGGYQCQDAGVCAAGTVCNAVTRQCDRACAMDRHCGNNAICEAGICTAACTPNNEKVVCDPATEVCGSAGHCVAKCTANVDCLDGFDCQTDSGRCLRRCDAGASCKDTEYCNAGRCTLKCNALNELRVCGTSLFCRTSTGQCLADCRTDETLCGAEACNVSGLDTISTADDLGICGRECVSDAECDRTPGGETLKCLTAGGVKRCQRP